MATAPQTVQDQAHVVIDTVKLLRAHLYAHHVRAARVSSPDAFDLTEAQFGAMMVVKDFEPMSLKRLAEILGVSAPSASAMVDRLVESGMLKRGTSSTDRRKVQIELSETGRAIVEDFEAVFIESAVDLLEKIGPESADQLCAAYARIQEVLQAEFCEGAATPAFKGDVAS